MQSTVNRVLSPDEATSSPSRIPVQPASEIVPADGASRALQILAPRYGLPLLIVTGDVQRAGAAFESFREDPEGLKQALRELGNWMAINGTRWPESVGEHVETIVEALDHCGLLGSATIPLAKFGFLNSAAIAGKGSTVRKVLQSASDNDRQQVLEAGADTLVGSEQERGWVASSSFAPIHYAALVGDFDNVNWIIEQVTGKNSPSVADMFKAGLVPALMSGYAGSNKDTNRAIGDLLVAIQQVDQAAQGGDRESIRIIADAKAQYGFDSDVPVTLAQLSCLYPATDGRRNFDGRFSVVGAAILRGHLEGARAMLEALNGVPENFMTDHIDRIRSDCRERCPTSVITYTDLIKSLDAAGTQTLPPLGAPVAPMRDEWEITKREPGPLTDLAQQILPLMVALDICGELQCNPADRAARLAAVFDSVEQVQVFLRKYFDFVDTLDPGQLFPMPEYSASAPFYGDPLSNRLSGTTLLGRRTHFLDVWASPPANTEWDKARWQELVTQYPPLINIVRDAHRIEQFCQRNKVALPDNYTDLKVVLYHYALEELGIHSNSSRAQVMGWSAGLEGFNRPATLHPRGVPDIQMIIVARDELAQERGDPGDRPFLGGTSAPEQRDPVVALDILGMLRALPVQRVVYDDMDMPELDYWRVLFTPGTATEGLSWFVEAADSPGRYTPMMSLTQHAIDLSPSVGTGLSPHDLSKRIVLKLFDDGFFSGESPGGTKVSGGVRQEGVDLEQIVDFLRVMPDGSDYSKLFKLLRVSAHFDRGGNHFFFSVEDIFGEDTAAGMARVMKVHKALADVMGEVP